jgi:hypothetical protein
LISMICWRVLQNTSISPRNTPTNFQGTYNKSPVDCSKGLTMCE